MERIVCIILLILYGVIMFIMCYIAIFQKKKSINNVRFFVEKETSNRYLLYIKNKEGICYICSDNSFKKFNLNPDNFINMKEGEIKEVFINLDN